MAIWWRSGRHALWFRIRSYVHASRPIVERLYGAYIYVLRDILVYLASLLALAIANKTSSAPLSSGAFLAIWMTFALAFGTAGARWYTMALIIIAALGGYVDLVTVTA